MIKQKMRLVAYVTWGVDLSLAVLSFYLAYWMRDRWSSGSLERLFSIENYHWLVFFMVPLWSIALYYTGSYRLSYSHSLASGILRSWAAIIIGVFGLVAVIFVFKSLYFSRLFIMTFAAANIAFTTAGRVFIYLARSRYRRRPLNVVIAGDGEAADKIASIVMRHRAWGLHLVGFVREKASASASAFKDVDTIGTVKDIPGLIHDRVIDEVIFAVSKETLDNMEDTLLLLEDEGINARVVLDIFPHMIAKVHIDELDNVPLLTFTTIPSNELALVIKRLCDIVIGFAALVVLSPVMLAVFALIKMTGPGRAVFVQRRSGLNGRVFDFYKFRSMYQDADQRKAELERTNEMDGPVFKMKNDPRITPVGRFIRRTSIDELPQLWNVIKGDMSIVGPRPPVPAEVERYERWQRRRLSMKPGITCIWQISGRNTIRFNDWIKLDLEYIDNWSLWLDVKILLKTIPAVLSGKGAY